MKQNVTFSMFHDACSPLSADFTYDGLRTIYDHILEIEQDAGFEQTFDPQVINDCYNEYASIQIAMKSEYEEDWVPELTDAECEEYMREMGIVWILENGRALFNPSCSAM